MAKWTRGDPEPPEPSYVYFLQCGGFVKIGLSKRPRQRLIALASVVPYEVDLILMLRGDRFLERRLHKRFEAQWHQNEWFLLDATIRSFIDENIQQCCAQLVDAMIGVPEFVRRRSRKFHAKAGRSRAQLGGAKGKPRLATGESKQLVWKGEIDLHAALRRNQEATIS